MMKILTQENALGCGEENKHPCIEKIRVPLDKGHCQLLEELIALA